MHIQTGQKDKDGQQRHNECISTQTVSSAGQRGLLDPIKPAYNQSQLDGWLNLTASTHNQLWISMLAVMVTVSTVTQNLLCPLSTS